MRKRRRSQPPQKSRKTLYKTVTWRLLSIGLTFSTSALFFGSVNESLSYTVVYSVLSTVLYYYHERLYKWLRANGKI